MLMTVINYEKTVIRPQYDCYNLIADYVESGDRNWVYVFYSIFDDRNTLINSIPCMENNVKVSVIKYLLFIIPPRGFLRSLRSRSHKTCYWKGLCVTVIIYYCGQLTKQVSHRYFS